MKHAISWISNFLESGEKLVVFATHKFVIDALMKEFEERAVKIVGGMSSTKRQQSIDKFTNEPETLLFVGNIEAAGHSINLTVASNVAFLELPWTPGELVQAEDRCHRIKQKDTVNVYYLLAEQTIEERIAELLDEKRKVLDSVLDGVQTDETSLLMELIENY
jgi:SWI/SNF-related matrix-associated actin-dependent regulator 1 of chromatin subfamily A